MDSLTHGLLGAALAALPLPRWVERRGAPTASLAASITVSVLAAELPDLDYLLPAADPVLHTLSAHRGYTHSLIAFPAVALVALLLTKAVFRRAPLAPLYARALLSVPLAHLLPDLWTGWGTRLFLPFSERRHALDWTMVLDPWLTAPLLLGAAWAVFRRRDFRRAMACGALVASAYLALRVGIGARLTRGVESAYPGAQSVQVFPSLFAVARWRYVAQLGADYAVGYVSLGKAPEEAARHRAMSIAELPAQALRAATVREALAWARFPVVQVTAAPASAQRIEVADLRYHLQGAPTLRFVMLVGPDGRVLEARLERGGSARELFKRFREPPGPR